MSILHWHLFVLSLFPYLDVDILFWFQFHYYHLVFPDSTHSNYVPHQ